MSIRITCSAYPSEPERSASGMNAAKTPVLVAILLLLLSNYLCAQKAAFPITEPLQPITSAVNANIATDIDPVRARIVNDVKGAEHLLDQIVRTYCHNCSGNQDVRNHRFTTIEKGAYFIIHLLKWTDPAAGKAPTVQAQNWYVYHDGKLEIGDSTHLPRLYAVKTVTLIYIHLNRGVKNAANEYKYDPYYEVEIDKKRPAYVDHLTALLGVVFSSAGAATPGFLAANYSENWVGIKDFDIKYVPSDISIQPNITKGNDVISLGSIQKFDNEGKYFFDVSIGIPISKVRASQVSFNGTTNVLEPKEVHRDTAFAFINLYYPSVDIKQNNFGFIPHFVGGVGLNKNPLHRIFVGTGFGPFIGNFYLGALFSKDQFINGIEPSPTNLTGPITYRFKPHFAFGFNLPVGAIAEKLKK